jgi:hypothetical protein
VERHQTLHDAVAWSYSLLTPQEQAIFEAVAVFSGGAFVDAVAEVAGVDEFEALDLLDQLIARSMLTATDTVAGTRYGQLETLRQFGLDRLADRGALEPMVGRHLAWASRLVAGYRASWYTSQHGAVFRRVCAEIDNLRSAVAFAASRGDHETAYQIVAGLRVLAGSRPVLEIANWADPLTAPGSWTTARAEAAAVVALLNIHLGNGDHATDVLGRIPDAYSTLTEVSFVKVFASLFLYHDVPAAEAHAARCLPRIRSEQLERQLWDLYFALFHTADGDYDRDDEVRRLEELREGMKALLATGDEVLGADALAVYANVLSVGERTDEAVHAARDATELAQSAGARFIADSARCIVARAIGVEAQSSPERIPELAATAHDVLRGAIEAGSPWLLSATLYNLALFIAQCDAALGMLCEVVARRHVAANPWLGDLADRLGPDAMDGITTRAQTIDVHDVAALVLAVLDEATSRPGGH